MDEPTLDFLKEVVDARRDVFANTELLPILQALPGAPPRLSLSCVYDGLRKLDYLSTVSAWQRSGPCRPTLIWLWSQSRFLDELSDHSAILCWDESHWDTHTGLQHSRA